MTIYFIQSDCGRVKVGYTDDSDPEARLRQLQTGSARKLTVLCYGAGSPRDERWLHRYLEADSVHGEWFTPSERLAKVIGYVEKFHRLTGFEKSDGDAFAWAKSRVEEIREMFKPEEPLPDPDQEWLRRLQRADREASALPPPAKPTKTFDWFPEWRSAFGYGKTDLEFIEHTGPEYPSSGGSAEWFWGSWQSSSGLAETATMLERYVAEPKKSAAVWILACIQDLTHSRRNERLPTLWSRAPDVADLSEQLEAFVPARWHRAATAALPFPMRLPARCLLTVDDFVEACATHRRLIVAESRLRFSWAWGSSVSLKHHAEGAAA